MSERGPYRHGLPSRPFEPLRQPRYVASYLRRRQGLLGLREIGERAGLHLKRGGQCVQWVTERPTCTMAKSLKELENKFKNQED
jgi:hypothetical protein